MAAGATYEPIATQTLASAASSITFSSIASSWTDLRLVLVGTNSSTGRTQLTFNGVTSTVYSITYLYGNGSAAGSSSNSGFAYIHVAPVAISTTIPAMLTIDVFSYAGSTYKTCLITAEQDNNGSGFVTNTVGLYGQTTAITSMALTQASGNFAIGTTATLYGIKAA